MRLRFLMRRAAAYGIQRELMRVYERIQDHFVEVAIMKRTPKFERLGPEELLVWRRTLALALEQLDAFERTSGSLARHYARALAPP